jgi:phage recombination protein Bet
MANEIKTNSNVSQAVLGANDKGRVTYKVNGEDVNLSFQIVRNYLTRGNGDVTDAEIIQFISICRENKLNPFVGDAYLVKYDKNSPAQMVTARDAFMKRAEAGQGYDGFQSGVIVIRDGKAVQEEGAFFLPGDTLIGGWAIVYRSDRKFPYTQRVRLQEYNTGRSTWAGKPATMIQKVAEAQAFRKAYPMNMAGLYIPEEMPDEQPLKIPTGEANKAIPQFREESTVDAPAPEQQPDPEREFTPDPEPEPVADKEQKEFTHWAGEKSFEFDPPIKVPVHKDEVDPAGERLPWEGHQQKEVDANLDLFKA